MLANITKIQAYIITMKAHITMTRQAYGNNNADKYHNNTDKWPINSDIITI